MALNDDDKKALEDNNRAKSEKRQADDTAKAADRALTQRLADRDERLNASQKKAGQSSSIGGRWDPTITGVPDVRKGINPEEVSKNLEIIAAQGGPPGGKAPSIVFKALKKNSGSIAIGVEYKRSNQEVMDSQALRVFSGGLRQRKVDVLLVDCSSPAGVSDCEGIITEQKTASMNFPGSVPVIRTGPTTTLTMVAEAKALGCHGVLISYLKGVNENADELVKGVLSLGLEPLVIVNSREHVEASQAAGAKIFVLEATQATSMFIDSPDVACRFMMALRAAVPADCVAVAGLEAHIGGPPSEVFLHRQKEGKGMSDGEVAEPKMEKKEIPKVLEFGAELRKIEPNNGGVSAIFAFSAAQSASENAERNFCYWLVDNLLSRKSSQFSVPSSNLFDLK